MTSDDLLALVTEQLNANMAECEATLRHRGLSPQEIATALAHRRSVNADLYAEAAAWVGAALAQHLGPPATNDNPPNGTVLH